MTPAAYVWNAFSLVVTLLMIVIFGWSAWWLLGWLAVMMMPHNE